MCYPDLFGYEIKPAEDRLLAYPVLKIVLQPLVENSILHGFQELPHQGRIVIEAIEADGMLTLAVTDNGTGMDAERVERLLNHPPDKLDSYALANVRSRLKLYYGDKAAMELYSEPGVATTVKLTIPIHEVIQE
jgi:two-component system sensor histidine kinase YesM